MKRPEKSEIAEMLAEAEAYTAPYGPGKIDERLHRAFGLKGNRPRALLTNVEGALEFIHAVLPDYGYRLLRGATPEVRDRWTAAMFQPAEDPDASLTDPRGWGRTTEAAGKNPAQALMCAALRALVEH